MEKQALLRYLNQSENKDIILDILVERARQNFLWGEQDHPLSDWSSLIGEEYGELCQAINDTKFKNFIPGKSRGGYTNMYKEAVQIGALAIQFLEYLKRLKDNGGIEDDTTETLSTDKRQMPG